MIDQNFFNPFQYNNPFPWRHQKQTELSHVGVLKCVTVSFGWFLQALMYQDPERWGITLQTYIQLTMLESHLSSGSGVGISERRMSLLAIITIPFLKCTGLCFHPVHHWKWCSHMDQVSIPVVIVCSSQALWWWWRGPSSAPNTSLWRICFKGKVHLQQWASDIN